MNQRIWLISLSFGLFSCGTILGADFDNLDAQGQPGGAPQGGAAASGGGFMSGNGAGQGDRPETSAGAGMAGDKDATYAGLGGGSPGAGAGMAPTNENPGGAGDGASPVGGGNADSGCPGKAGPLMVQVPRPDGGTMCIDATEVTREQYSDFSVHAGKKEKESQSPDCHWNNSFAASPTCLELPGVCPGKDPACSKHPVVCIDQCDAKAYCAWAGKRLCGAIEGGTLPFDDDDGYNVAAISQWMNACSAGEQLSVPSLTYPYGNDWQPVCNDSDATLCEGPQCSSTPVGSQVSCVTGGNYAGIFDLTGNVWEWEDSCEDAPMGQGECRVRGGSYADDRSFQTCAYNYSWSRHLPDPHIGFRCCGP